MSEEESMAEALMILERSDPKANQIPAMIIMSPESTDFIIGNSGGLVRLAIASLKAASGEQQLFKQQPWIFQEDFDWGVSGIRLDESAHTYLPTKPTRIQALLRNAIGLILLLLIVGCLLAGAISLGGVALHWLRSLR